MKKYNTIRFDLRKLRNMAIPVIPPKHSQQEREDGRKRVLDYYEKKKDFGPNSLTYDTRAIRQANGNVAEYVHRPERAKHRKRCYRKNGSALHRTSRPSKSLV